MILKFEGKCGAAAAAPLGMKWITPCFPQRLDTENDGLRGLVLLTTSLSVSPSVSVLSSKGCNGRDASGSIVGSLLCIIPCMEVSY